MSFWDSWGALIQRLIASVGSLLSLTAFMFMFMPQPVKLEGIALVLLLLTLILAAISIWLEVRSELVAARHRKSFKENDALGIKGYMRRWIGHSGRAAVWTRDLSWVDDEETLNLLKSKAGSGGLTIYLPQETEMSQRLAKAGATICAYGGRAFKAPESRFTIAFLGNGGSKVAIGRRVNGLHIIEELGSGDPSFLMASDLVSLATLLAEKGGADGRSA